MTADGFDWVVWDLNQPDSHGPAWGPMSEDEARAMEAARPWRHAQKITKQEATA